MISQSGGYDTKHEKMEEVAFFIFFVFQCFSKAVSRAMGDFHFKPPGMDPSKCKVVGCWE